MKYRVIQFGTGFVGHFALRAIIEHPDLELVGVWVHSEDKVGKDAGDLCERGLVGVKATNDFDVVLALDADCVCSAAGGDGREQWMANAHARILESGKNIVSSSIVGMVHPPSFADKSLLKILQDACQKGGTSYWTSGIEPGFCSDTLPLSLTGLSQYWESIRIQELLNYSTYIPQESRKLMFDVLGFGMPLDYEPILFQPGRLTYVWGGPIRAMADGLDVKIEEIREVSWRLPAKETYEIEGLGRIEKGTAEALRFELQGISGGREVIVVEHVTRLRKGAAPEWPQGDLGAGYYIKVEGDPVMTCFFSQTDAAGDHVRGGILSTATRLVNAIPAVCSAEPGLLSALDLPLVAGRNLYRPS
jgi:4-hydroxy-tetrahydrodipicolinate reductase